MHEIKLFYTFCLDLFIILQSFLDTCPIQRHSINMYFFLNNKHSNTNKNLSLFSNIKLKLNENSVLLIISYTTPQGWFIQT